MTERFGRLTLLAEMARANGMRAEVAFVWADACRPPAGVKVAPVAVIVGDRHGSSKDACMGEGATVDEAMRACLAAMFDRTRVAVERAQADAARFARALESIRDALGERIERAADETEP